MYLPEILLQSITNSLIVLIRRWQIFVQIFKSVYEWISNHNSNRNYRNWLLAAQALLSRNVGMAWNSEAFRHEKCIDHIKLLKISALEDNNIWCCCMRNVELAWSSERFRHCKTNNVRSCCCMRAVEVSWSTERFRHCKTNNVGSCCCMRDVQISWSSERFRHCKTNNVGSYCCTRYVEISWSAERFRHCKTNNVGSCCCMRCRDRMKLWVIQALEDKNVLGGCQQYLITWFCTLACSGTEKKD